MSGKIKATYSSCAFSLLILSVLFFSACARPNYQTPKPDQNDTITHSTCSLAWSSQTLCLSWVWETPASASSYGSMILQVSRPHETGRVLQSPAGEIKLVLWMPSMGHGSVPTQTEIIAPGLYRLKNIFFIMPGEWDLHFQLLQNGVKVDETVQRMNL